MWEHVNVEKNTLIYQSCKKVKQKNCTIYHCLRFWYDYIYVSIIRWWIKLIIDFESQIDNEKFPQVQIYAQEVEKTCAFFHCLLLSIVLEKKYVLFTLDSKKG